MNAALHWPPRQLVHDVRDTNPTRQPHNAPPLNLRKSEATPCSPFPHATPRNATPRHTTTRNTTPSYAIPCQPSPSQTRETNSPRHTILPDDTKDKATTRMKQIHIILHKPPLHSKLRYAMLFPATTNATTLCHATLRYDTTQHDLPTATPLHATLRHLYRRPRHATRQAR